VVFFYGIIITATSTGNSLRVVPEAVKKDFLGFFLWRLNVNMVVWLFL